MISNDTLPKNNEQLSILCRNLYMGADYLTLFPQDKQAILLGQIVDDFYQKVATTQFDERAKVFAAEIASRKPHVICLQEVFSYQSSTPTGCIDFLAILLQELSNLGEKYEIAIEASASTVELPSLLYGELGAYDKDVILVRYDIAVLGKGCAQFSKMQTLSLPNDTHLERRDINIRRAYGWVQVDWLGAVMYVINTHLDDSPINDVRTTQARELCEAFAMTSEPVVLAGDLNAAPNSDAYTLFREAGFKDPFEIGNKATYGANSTLLNDPLILTERIDHIFTRGPILWRDTEHFGNDPALRIPPSMLWPSDHAGLMLTLSLEATHNHPNVVIDKEMP